MLAFGRSMRTKQQYDAPRGGKRRPLTLSGGRVGTAPGCEHTACRRCCSAVWSFTPRWELVRAPTEKPAAAARKTLGKIYLGFPKRCVGPRGRPQPPLACPVKLTNALKAQGSAEFCGSITAVALFIDGRGFNPPSLEGWWKVSPRGQSYPFRWPRGFDTRLNDGSPKQAL